MSQRQLTGSRIRERRIDLKIRQAELAQAVGISASYLNLIEHNRRRIGGKLLNDIARAMDVDASSLTEGAETALLDQLRAAAAHDRAAEAEVARTEDFAGRFIGWASLVVRQARRIEDLEARVKALTDRLAHDPQLSSSLHEVISSATSIRSAASILVSGDDIDRDWEQRFHRNIYEDSQRLAESSRAVVSYLDTPNEEGAVPFSPQEEVEAYLEANDYHLEQVEAGHASGEAPKLRTKAATRMLARYQERYEQDAEAMPLSEFSKAALEVGHDPAQLAARFDVDLPSVMRRLASLPSQLGHPPMGLVIVDGAGVITTQRQISGFGLPRTGAACPLWPVYRALNQPMQPIRREVSLPVEGGGRFKCHAIAVPAGPASFEAPPVFEATMLVQQAVSSGTATDPVGVSCRICPRSACRARREPSILNDTDAR